MKKFILTEETKDFYGIKLFRIKRLSDGLLGGWVEKESNLSQDGDCFIYGSAEVYGSARVYGSAEATKLVHNFITLPHSITVTDNLISIGCEQHPLSVWLESYVEIGKKHNCTYIQIAIYKKLLVAIKLIMETQK